MLEQHLAIKRAQIFVHLTGHSHLHSKKQILARNIGPFGIFFSVGFGVRPVWFVPLLLLIKAYRGAKRGFAEEGSYDPGKSHITSELRSCFVVRIK